MLLRRVRVKLVCFRVVAVILTLVTLTVSAKNVTIKDFSLGMTTAEISSLFRSLGLKPSSYGNGLYNQCSSNKGESLVNPLQFGGSFGKENHLYDQACQAHKYDLLGSNVEVKAMLHGDKLFWVNFYSRGGLAVSDNEALVGALHKKYGKPKKFKYRDIFGQETGLEWRLESLRGEIRRN